MTNWCPQHGYPIPCDKCGYDEPEDVIEVIKSIANEDPCVGCKKKEEDDYGLVCDMICTEHMAYMQRELMRMAILEALGEDPYPPQEDSGEVK